MPVPLRVLAGGGFQSTSFFVRDCDGEIRKEDQYCACAKSSFDRIYMLMLPIVPRLRNIGANFVDRLSQPLH